MYLVAHGCYVTMFRMKIGLLYEMVLQCLVYMASCIVLLFSACEFLTEANASFELLAK